MDARTEQFLRELHTMLLAICDNLGIEIESPLSAEVFREQYAKDFMTLVAMGMSEEEARAELDAEVARERAETAMRREGHRALLQQALANTKQSRADKPSTKKEAVSG